MAGVTTQGERYIDRVNVDETPSWDNQKKEGVGAHQKHNDAE